VEAMTFDIAIARPVASVATPQIFLNFEVVERKKERKSVGTTFTLHLSAPADRYYA
jgi:hypothetical protein